MSSVVGSQAASLHRETISYLRKNIGTAWDAVQDNPNAENLSKLREVLEESQRWREAYINEQ